MGTRSRWWRHAPDAVAQNRSPLHLNGCCRVAHLCRCTGSPSQRNSHRSHRCWRGDEVRLASAQCRVRPAIRYRSSELATQGRPILRLPAIVLSREAFCLWKSFLYEAEHLSGIGLKLFGFIQESCVSVPLPPCYCYHDSWSDGTIIHKLEELCISIIP